MLKTPRLTRLALLPFSPFLHAPWLYVPLKLAGYF